MTPPPTQQLRPTPTRRSCRTWRAACACCTGWVLSSTEGRFHWTAPPAETLPGGGDRHTVADIVNELESLFDTQGIAPQVHELLAEGTRRGWLD